MKTVEIKPAKGLYIRSMMLDMLGKGEHITNYVPIVKKTFHRECFLSMDINSKELFQSYHARK